VPVGHEAHRGVALGGTGLGSSVAGRDAAALTALAARRRLIHIQMNMVSSGSGRSTCFVAGVRGDAPRGCLHRQHRPARAGDDSSVPVSDSTPIWAVRSPSLPVRQRDTFQLEIAGTE